MWFANFGVVIFAQVTLHNTHLRMGQVLAATEKFSRVFEQRFEIQLGAEVIDSKLRWAGGGEYKDTLFRRYSRPDPLGRGGGWGLGGIPCSSLGT